MALYVLKDPWLLPQRSESNAVMGPLLQDAGQRRALGSAAPSLHNGQHVI